jgi:proteic killer suppression protein
MGTRVNLDPVKKALSKGKVPQPIITKLQRWVSDVEMNGIAEARKRPGYHDEPLAGDRKGQRSVRLNDQWRAIYVMKVDASGETKVEFVQVEEVTPHAY